jgi:hypothetical protein
MEGLTLLSLDVRPVKEVAYMKKISSFLLELVGFVFMFTYEHITLMAVSIGGLIWGIIKCFEKSNEYYAIQLGYLEKVSHTYSRYQGTSLLWDMAALGIFLILLVYLNELYRYHFHGVTFLEVLCRMFGMDIDSEEDDEDEYLE